MANLKITAMDHIVLNVGDVERSLSFYSDVLGLKPERVDEFRAGRVGFPSVRISDTCLIDLVAASDVASDSKHGNLNHFCLVAEPADLQALADGLAAQGVTLTVGTPSSRWGARGQAMSIYLLDPDGNEIEVRCY